MLPGPNRARARKPSGIIIRKLLQCLGKRQWGLELGGKNGGGGCPMAEMWRGRTLSWK